MADLELLRGTRLLDVVVRTLQGAEYAMPDVHQSTAIRFVEELKESPRELPMIVNISGAVMGIPYRIMASVTARCGEDSKELWKREES